MASTILLISVSSVILAMLLNKNTLSDDDDR